MAHVDAGKTSLTERLLHAAGVIDEIGRVDDGNTQTDTLALERQRGITIKSAVVSFEINGTTVNLIDTPGHPDFIAEVERVLGVLDGAVLVVSAVEGVQAQTRVLMRTLRRLGIPTLVFVNKIDRRGAGYDRVLRAIAEKLTPATVPMGTVRGLGTREAGYADGVPADRLVEVLAEHDDAVLAGYVADAPAPPLPHLRAVLATQTGRTLVHPVYFGSAVTGAGVEPLIRGITELLPAATGDPAGPVAGTVFKIDRGAGGEKIAYLRMFSGTLRVRDRVPFGDGAAGRVTGLRVFADGAAARRDAVTAGEIAQVRGLEGVRIGDPVGAPRGPAGDHVFAPPSLETVVVPRRPADRGALHAALTQLAEQDPLINLRVLPGELHLSLFGEVQKEVIQATLADDFGVDADFRRSRVICIERPVGVGAAVEYMGQDGNPFLATVGLRVEPAPVGAGVRFGLEVELGAMPYAFFAAVEDTVTATLAQGLCGWRVTDCVITMTHSGYAPRQSHAHATFDKSMSSTGSDFRHLTPLVLMAALRRAGTRVCEPVHRYSLEAPADTLGAVTSVLARLGAVPGPGPLAEVGPGVVAEVGPGVVAGVGPGVLAGVIPAGSVHELRQRLPGLTRGEGVLETTFDRYEPVRGPAPTRPRTDHNPLDREEYLLRVVRRVV
ncbi:translation factor GTPase family protein [Actinomycetes bacterium KLBMP 9797]